MARCFSFPSFFSFPRFSPLSIFSPKLLPVRSRLVVRLRTTSVIQSVELPVILPLVTNDARTFYATMVTASTTVASELRAHSFCCPCRCEMFSVIFYFLAFNQLEEQMLSSPYAHCSHLPLRHIYPYSVEKSPTFFGQSPLSMDHSTRFMTHSSELPVFFCKESKLFSLPSSFFSIKYGFCSILYCFPFSSHSLLASLACYSFFLSIATPISQDACTSVPKLYRPWHIHLVRRNLESSSSCGRGLSKRAPKKTYLCAR